MTDRDRLIELIYDAKCVETWDYYNDEPMQPCPIEKLADYLLANGVTVLDFKVGNKVYFHQFDNDCKKVVVEGKIIKTSKNARECTVVLKDERKLRFRVDFIGKTVFLTKEEAEEKLKELNDNDRQKN